MKPGNILLTADGIPKITDFGIAKCLEGGATLTETGMVLGTPSYMAPEQAVGTSQKLGPGCDVYALGAILYEMLTGRPPFQAATPFETLEQVRSQEVVPPRRLQPKVPRDLETICLKCLRKEPQERYSSAALLAEDLARYLRDEPVMARPAGELERFRRWCRRNPAVALLTATVAALLVVTAVVATVAAFWFEHVADEAERVRQREAAERSKAETALTDMYTAYGLTTASQGDPARALLWFANAALKDHEPARRHASEVRVRSWSRQVPTPVAALRTTVCGSMTWPSTRAASICSRSRNNTASLSGMWSKSGLWTGPPDRSRLPVPYGCRGAVSYPGHGARQCGNPRFSKW